MTILHVHVFNDACESPITQRLLNEILNVRLVLHAAGGDLEAAAEVYREHPNASDAVARAEAADLTQDEQRELLGDMPDRVQSYCARSWSLVEDALVALQLPPQVTEQVSGDTIALFAAALCCRDLKETAEQENAA